MRVIQVGIGGMGNAWLGAVQRSPEVEFATLVEIDADIADQQAEAYGLDRSLIFRALPEALAQVNADAVIADQFDDEAQGIGRVQSSRR